MFFQYNQDPYHGGLGLFAKNDVVGRNRLFSIASVCLVRTVRCVRRVAVRKTIVVFSFFATFYELVLPLSHSPTINIILFIIEGIQHLTRTIRFDSQCLSIAFG
jgi:hypothetical protein